MAVIKIACPKCGQKVSGDETFYGRNVNCPICTSKIVFPQNPSQTPDLDSLVSGSATNPVNHSTSTTPPTQEPTFETIYPTNQPGAMSQPAASPPPASQEFPPGPSFDSQPPSNPVPPVGEAPIPPVPKAPDYPTTDEEDAVPSPLLGAVSLVIGILNTVTACVGGILLAPVAIILGHAALAKAKHSPVKPAPGQSLAMIGVILGYAGLVCTILILVALLAFKEPFTEFLKSVGEA